MIILNSASSAAALVFYLPGVSTHTDTEGKQRKTRVWNILKSLEKKPTIFNEHCTRDEHIYLKMRRTSAKNLEIFLKNLNIFKRKTMKWKILNGC